MQIHELNTFVGNPGDMDFLPIDNGFDTQKISVPKLYDRKVNQPIDESGNPVDGNAGDVLRTKGNGGTEWAPVGQPTDAQTAQAVSDWLDAHPEATTTVLDGSITEAKLDADLSSKQAVIITNYNELIAAIADGDQNTSYICREITINSAIELTSANQAACKSFSNGVFILNDNLFSWANPGNYHNSPNFVNCTFIGNGNTIFADGSYVLGGKFVNCNFIDCGFVHNGKFVQSPRFVNCLIENTVNNTFIHALQVYEARFIGCQIEAQNKAIIIDAYTTAANTASTNQIEFANCVIEGQTNYVVRMRDGDITINSVYTEANEQTFIKVLASNRSVNPILRIDIHNSRINPKSNVYFVELDASYENSNWTFFKCENCNISQGNLINTNKTTYCVIDNIRIDSSGKRVAANELSGLSYAASNSKNSVADFSTSGHVIVKKSPALITFDSNDGGRWHTNLYFVTLNYGNTPNVICLSDPSKTISAVYDSDTGFIDVTLHANRNSALNASAVLLTQLVNNLARRDYYDSVLSGY